jgi:acyl-CoA synthetase (AMP-forming)/AMP-acid ligase II
MPDLLGNNSVVLGDQEFSWDTLLEAFNQSATRAVLERAAQPVAVVVDGAAEAFGVVAGLAATGGDALLLGRERLSEGVRALLETRGFALCDYATGNLTPAAQPAPAVPGRVSLLTSGSTGTPKLVPHRWETLFTGRDLRSASPRRWLVPYQTGTYAWYQLITLGMFLPGQTLVVAGSDDLETIFAQAARHAVDSISATPTFWRLACLRLPESLLRSVRLTTITLGGEMADQSILDRLAALFPGAQVTHIYASTEAGVCAVVKDGRAGFPSAWLDREQPGSPALRIEDGRLWVRSPHAAGGAGEWLDSGDRVEARGDRVHFVGRADSALINVGGSKAYPADIEAVLLAHPAVRWCRVRAVRSPLVGWLPEADVVCDPRADAVPDEVELTRFCAARLPEYAVPRFWNHLATIPVQGSLKSAL